jgi:hypothetical protein
MLRMCRTNKKLAGYRGKPAWEELAHSGEIPSDLAPDLL